MLHKLKQISYVSGTQGEETASYGSKIWLAEPLDIDNWYSCIWPHTSTEFCSNAPLLKPSYCSWSIWLSCLWLILIIYYQLNAGIFYHIQTYTNGQITCSVDFLSVNKLHIYRKHT